MSTASKITLGTTILSTIGILVFVHHSQKVEQAAMHEGVIRDMDQQRLRAERQLDFDTQAALEAKLRQEQAVNDGRGGIFAQFSRKT